MLIQRVMSILTHTTMIINMKIMIILTVSTMDIIMPTKKKTMVILMRNLIITKAQMILFRQLKTKKNTMMISMVILIMNILMRMLNMKIIMKDIRLRPNNFMMKMINWTNIMIIIMKLLLKSITMMFT
jgi:hypothetical protein